LPPKLSEQNRCWTATAILEGLHVFFLQNVHLYSSIMVKITSNIKKKKKKRKKDITQILTCRTHYFKVSTAQTDTIKLGKSKLNWYDGNLT